MFDRLGEPVSRLIPFSGTNSFDIVLLEGGTISGVGECCDNLAGLMPGRGTDQMAPSKDLIAVDVHTEDVGDYNVTEAGWYAVDDADKVVLGPFLSLAECERAIRDRKALSGT